MASRRPTALKADEWLTNAPVAAVATLCEEEADLGEQEDRQAEPLAKGERDGVEAEVMGQFVGEYAGHLVARQRVDRIRRDDEQASTAGKGVELV